MRDLMLDLETMSTSPRAAIVAIGAVVFDPQRGELGAPFYARVDLATSMRSGGHVEASTVLWWLAQSAEARAELLDETNRFQLPEALRRLSSFIEIHAEGPKRVRVWGNGSDFDNVILSSAYERAHLERPWKFYHNRCYRTVKNLYPDVPMVTGGVIHRALDDACNQAQHLCQIYERHLNRVASEDSPR